MKCFDSESDFQGGRWDKNGQNAFFPTFCGALKCLREKLPSNWVSALVPKL